MKFKVYGWKSGYQAGDPEDEYRSTEIELVPIVRIVIDRHNFAPDSKPGRCPFRRKGTNVFLLLG